MHETQLLLKTSYNGGLLVRYLQDAYPVLRTLVYPFSVFVLLSFFLTRAYLRNKLRLAPALQVGAGLLTLAFLVYEALRTDLYRNTHLNHNRSIVWFLAIMLVVLAMFSAVYLEQPRKKVDWNKIIIAGWLVMLPFVGAIGTYNNLFINVMLDINYWLALLCILYVSMPAIAHSTAVRVIVFLVPTLVIAQQYAYGLLYAPYLQAANMLQQNVPVTLGRNHTSTVLQLDAKTAAFIGDLRQTMKRAGFEPGMPVVAMYDMPGLVYMLDGISPGNPWLFGQLDLRNCDALAKTRLDLTKAFLLVNEKPGLELLTCMESHGMRFPQDYREVKKLLNPYNPNQYNWRNNQDTLTVYAPVVATTAR
ncbi:hypothetical protein [Hymenobacter sp. UYP22]|uniref:hypothetical protein n=1 Tax=Hymenobacter sp. UYP22 TaxID=3156348 RepID=UPI0033987AF8